MSVDLSKHIDHNTEISKVGNTIELECLTCREVLLSQPAPTLREAAAPQPAPVCNMDDPECLSCGS